MYPMIGGVTCTEALYSMLGSYHIGPSMALRSLYQYRRVKYFAFHPISSPVMLNGGII